ncbi:putative small secreted protein [Treponema rectale]|uniref:Putative small secreted protein n=1 Tax=Treponema rectale TaxID=744512 RepID=A0A840SJX0_9SPIR|nr:leucine-rich repeat domain-containing protein [Treponema rectale]MBB5219661.1 putative small secreted protein [Treponema rectale]
MKKRVFVFFATVLLAFSFSACNKKDGKKEDQSKTETVSKDVKEDKGVLKENPASDFKYTMTDDGTGVKITEYIGKSPKIIIPAEIENLPVLEVEDLAKRDHEYGEAYWSSIFEEWTYHRNNVTITHIVFPDSVRSTGLKDVGALSLEHYDALEYVKLPAGIIEWEDKDIPSLYYTAHKSPLTGRGVPVNTLPQMSNCAKLKTVIIPEGIKAIPVFENCPALESISLPASVEYVPPRAFTNCGSLKEVNIPDSVEKIAFYYKGEFLEPEQFGGTNLNLKTQAKLKQLGYTGTFGSVF